MPYTATLQLRAKVQPSIKFKAKVQPNIKIKAQGLGEMISVRVSLSSTTFLNRGAIAFSPYSLFTFGTQGIWLDPSDVANLSWRRNLLTYSEQFDNAVWLKTNSTAATNASAAPDGTTTAEKLVENTATATHSTNQNITVSSGAAHTFSLYIKAAERGFAQVRYENGASSQLFAANVNLSDGTFATTSFGSPSGTSAIVSSVGNGWYRVSVTATASDTTFKCIVFAQSALGSNTYTGDGTSGILIWGAQLELGTSATDYQRISDVNTEVIERFPTATMYQDAAGTTPVTTPGQPVGLRLDKSKGLVLGAELVANGDFATDTAWTKGTGWTIASGVATTATGTSGTLDQAVTVIAGRAYRIDYTITGWSSGQALLIFSGGTTVLGPLSGTGNGARSIILIAATGNAQLRVLKNSSSDAFSIDNISVKELAGNHATQSVLASRPVYGIEPAGGRRNVFTYSQDFDNAIWVKVNASVSGSTLTALNSSNSARIQQQFLAASGQQRTVKVRIASGTSPSTGLRVLNSTSSIYARCELSWVAGVPTVSSASGADSAVIADVGGGQYDVTMVFTPLENANQNLSYYIDLGAGNRTTSLYAAQLELGSTATNYQRVTTAFDVTEAGVQTCHYVQYDGSDDGMITNSIDFTATDKMSVFAGVKKTTGNNNAVVIESSAAWPTNAGSFAVIANDGSIENYGAKANFTTLTSYRATRVGSTTDVVSLVWNFSATSGELSTQLAMKLNGESQSVGGAGGTAAPFGNYKLNIGRRGNDQVTPTLPFNGRDYGIVVVGKATTADEITATERWLSGKTGFYAPIITGVPTIGVS